MKKFWSDYYLVKSSYKNNGRLALLLENEEEMYGDITINLPTLELEENCIFLNEWCPIEEMEKVDLFEVINYVNYNYGRYAVARLNMDVLNTYAIGMKED